MSAPAVSLAPKHLGEPLIDAMSPVHALVGFAAGLVGLDPHAAVAMFIGARLVEHSLHAGPRHALLKREKGQSLGNELGDLLCEVAGLHYGKLLREKLTAPPPPPAPAAGFGHYHSPYVRVR